MPSEGASPVRLSSLLARTPERLGWGGTGSSLVRANSSWNTCDVTNVWHIVTYGPVMMLTDNRTWTTPGWCQHNVALPCSCRGKSRKCLRGKLEAGRSCLWTPPGTGMKQTRCRTEIKNLLLKCFARSFNLGNLGICLQFEVIHHKMKNKHFSLPRIGQDAFEKFQWFPA